MILSHLTRASSKQFLPSEDNANWYLFQGEDPDSVHELGSQ